MLTQTFPADDPPESMAFIARGSSAGSLLPAGWNLIALRIAQAHEFATCKQFGFRTDIEWLPTEEASPFGCTLSETRAETTSQKMKGTSADKQKTTRGQSLTSTAVSYSSRVILRLHPTFRSVTYLHGAAGNKNVPGLLVPVGPRAERATCPSVAGQTGRRIVVRIGVRKHAEGLETLSRRWKSRQNDCSHTHEARDARECRMSKSFTTFGSREGKSY